MHRRIDVLTDNLPEVRKHGNGFVVKPAALRLLPWMSVGSLSFPPLVAAVAGLSATEFVCYAREQVMTILPDSPPRLSI